MRFVAEYYIDINQKEKESELDKYYNKELSWRTGVGDLVLIQDMTQRHLKNTIKYLANHNGSAEMLFILTLEQLKRETETKF